MTKQGLVLPVRWKQNQNRQAANQDGGKSGQDCVAKSQLAYVLVSDLPDHHAVLVRTHMGYACLHLFDLGE